MRAMRAWHASSHTSTITTSNSTRFKSVSGAVSKNTFYLHTRYPHSAQNTLQTTPRTPVLDKRVEHARGLIQTGQPPKLRTRSPRFKSTTVSLTRPQKHPFLGTPHFLFLPVRHGA